jgi:hypothetical protein
MRVLSSEFLGYQPLVLPDVPPRVVLYADTLPMIDRNVGCLISGATWHYDTREIIFSHSDFHRVVRGIFYVEIVHCLVT